MSSFIPICMNSFKYNFIIKDNNKKSDSNNDQIKCELNPNATEFIPEKKEKISLITYDDEKFDALEKDFVKNNDWIFYI